MSPTSTASASALEELFSGFVQQLSIPACKLTAEDLRQLYGRLQKKADEAAEFQLQIQPPIGQTPAEVVANKEAVRNLLRLTVKVQSPNGEWTGGQTADALQDKNLPAHIEAVDFSSTLMYRGRFNSDPNNWFTLHIDLRRPPVLDFSNLAISPAQNGSVAHVSGSNSTWANGCAAEITKFFKERRSVRNWLHSRFTYDAVVLPIGFPLSLYAVAHADRFLRSRLTVPEAIFVAVDVYVVLVALMSFRIFFNYIRWIYPKVEGPSRIHGGLGVHKTFAVIVAGTIISTIVRSALHLLGIG